MIITIPTYGRALAQRTYFNLPQEVRKNAFLVVQHREQHLYTGGNVLILPDNIRDIASTRDHICDVWPNHKVLMLDDDLDFAIRRTDDPTRFYPSAFTDITQCLESLDNKLDTFAHVSVSGREGANRDVSVWKYNGRAMRVLGFRTEVIRQHNLKFAPGTFMCDFYMTLQLLTRGYTNAIANFFVHNQPGSDTAGGCSTQRTPELQRAAAEFLAAEFPQFVTVVQKQTKTSWKGAERYDVRIQWKRAYESAPTSGKINVLDDGERGCTGTEGERGSETLVA